MISPEWGGGDRVNWQDALDYCDILILAQKDDWRLPNVEELRSLVDCGRFAPMIDPVFNAESSNPYWSSTSSLTNPANALCVSFETGGSWESEKIGGSHHFVRAVREGVD